MFIDKIINSLKWRKREQEQTVGGQMVGVDIEIAFGALPQVVNFGFRRRSNRKLVLRSSKRFVGTEGPAEAAAAAVGGEGPTGSGGGEKSKDGRSGEGGAKDRRGEEEGMQRIHGFGTTDGFRKNKCRGEDEWKRRVVAVQ